MRAATGTTPSDEALIKMLVDATSYAPLGEGEVVLYRREVLAYARALWSAATEQAEARPPEAATPLTEDVIREAREAEVAREALTKCAQMLRDDGWKSVTKDVERFRDREYPLPVPPVREVRLACGDTVDCMPASGGGVWLLRCTPRGFKSEGRHPYDVLLPSDTLADETKVKALAASHPQEK